MAGQYNLKNPAVKRLMKEAQELRESTEQYFAQPLEDNLFEWHFTIRGPVDSEFDGGVYHGRITLPPEYPMKPPSIMLLTPNGRFETFKKICLSISGHHPESWQPSWSIRTALLAIIGFMPTHGNGAIGSLDYTPDERKVLAKRSIEWKCPECGSTKAILKPVTEASKKTTEEAKEIASQINFQGEKEKKAVKKESGEAADAEAGTEEIGAATPNDTVGSAASAAGSVPANPLIPGFPPFPQAMFPANFPGGMPNAAMPPQMMGPGGAMVPFPRPFWPAMAAGGVMPPRMPGMMYPWPPLFNPMAMNPQMMAMMNQSIPATPPAPTTTAPSSTATSSTTVTSSAPNTTTPTTTSASSSSSSSRTATEMQASSSPPASSTPSVPQSEASSGGVSTASSAESITTTTTTSSVATSPIATPAVTTGLRQRTAATSASPPVVAATFGTAELPTAQRGENPAVVLVMALLGLLIIALILRRLYNVINAGAFNNDF